MFLRTMPNNYVAKREFFASAKLEDDASDDDNIDTKEVAERSLEDNTENLRVRHLFTCTVCNTRTAKEVRAYNEGVDTENLVAVKLFFRCDWA